MRRSSRAPVLVAALLGVASAFAVSAEEPRPTPTPANAVDPSDLSAVAPAFPERAAQTNPEVPFAPIPTPPSPLSTPIAVPSPSPAAAPETETPTVSAPLFSAPPASGSAHARPGLVTGKPVAVTHGFASTVTDYQKGKSLTVKTPSGSLVKYGIARDALLPDDLAPGRQVLVETKVVKRSRVATKVSYADGRIVISNVN